MPRIAALLIYPIEACRAARVKACVVGARGLENDRLWRVLDAADKPVGVAELGRVFVEVKGTEYWIAAAGHERLVLPAQLAQADAWFSKLLGRPCRLIARPLDEVAPLLATTTASLARLNKALPDAVPVERFGPNLVLEGTDPFEEDHWRAVRVGGAKFLASAAGGAHLPFGVELLPELKGTTTAQLRAGQTLDVEKA